MNNLQVGDYVYRHGDDPLKPKCLMFVIERFCLEPYTKKTSTWGPKPGDKRAPSAVVAPCNWRTLSKVPGRKAQIEVLTNLRRLNVLDAMARVG